MVVHREPTVEEQDSDNPIEWLEDHVWNPGGDPARLRALADAWDTMGDQLDGYRYLLESHVRRLTPGGWEGEAATAFEGTWNEMAAELTENAAEFRQYAAHLREVAGELEAVNNEVHALLIELGATIAVTGLLSLAVPLVGGLTAARAATLIGRITAAVGRLGAVLARVASLMRAMPAPVSKFLIRFAFNFAGGLAAQSAGNKITKDSWTLSWQDVAIAGVVGGVAGAAAPAALETKLFFRLASTRTAPGWLRSAGGTIDNRREWLQAHHLLSGSATGTAAGAGGTYAGEGIRTGEWTSSEALIKTVIGGVVGGTAGAVGEAAATRSRSIREALERPWRRDEVSVAVPPEFRRTGDAAPAADEIAVPGGGSREIGPLPDPGGETAGSGGGVSRGTAQQVVVDDNVTETWVRDPETGLLLPPDSVRAGELTIEWRKNALLTPATGVPGGVGSGLAGEAAANAVVGHDPGSSGGGGPPRPPSEGSESSPRHN
ncbi:MAG: WXG100 family type VII secretion target [Carbonactinosporaceae bacterium]